MSRFISCYFSWRSKVTLKLVKIIVCKLVDWYPTKRKVFELQNLNVFSYVLYECWQGFWKSFDFWLEVYQFGTQGKGFCNKQLQEEGVGTNSGLSLGHAHKQNVSNKENQGWSPNYVQIAQSFHFFFLVMEDLLYCK